LKYSIALNATGTQGSFDCKDPDAKTTLCCPKNAVSFLVLVIKVRLNTETSNFECCQKEFKKKNKDLGALCREIETTVN
jgi:hypothetical protein